MLNKIREALGVWRTELNKLERELEKKLQRLAFLQEAPLPAAELADIVCDRMIGMGDFYFHLRLEKKLGALLRKPLTEWRTQDKLADVRRAAKEEWHRDPDLSRKYTGGFDSYLNRQFVPNGHFPEFIGSLGHADAGLLLWALKEPIGAAIREAIINWDAYPKAGPPLAERQKEITKLEKEIPKLQQQIESSRAEAAEVGVDAGELHQRAPVPKRTRDLKR